MALMHYPLLVEIQDDDAMAALMEDLASAGFMDRTGFVPIVPWSDYVGSFYDDNGTMPTHILLTDSSFDEGTDGLAIELCGEQEMANTMEAFPDGFVREIGFDSLRGLVDTWVAW